jgi:hypothetical protein
VNEELEKSIEARFPSLFPKRERAKGGAPYAWFGMEIPEGWAPLVVELCERIKDAPVRFSQIKEKFGLLRVYVDSLDIETRVPAWVDEAVADVEHKSATTCEMCGQPGLRRSGGWTRVLCDAHAVKSPKPPAG